VVLLPLVLVSVGQVLALALVGQLVVLELVLALVSLGDWEWLRE
jgi:hypothetical protein